MIHTIGEEELYFRAFRCIRRMNERPLEYRTMEVNDALALAGEELSRNVVALLVRVIRDEDVTNLIANEVKR